MMKLITTFYIVSLLPVSFIACQTLGQDDNNLTSTKQLSCPSFEEGRELAISLAQSEKGNYAGSYLDGLECNSRIFLFVRNPIETLRRSSVEENFTAEKAEYSLIELDNIREQTNRIVNEDVVLKRVLGEAQIDERFNRLVLHHSEGDQDIINRISTIRSRLHPAVAILTDDDIGMIE